MLCVYSLESPHRGDSNEYTQHTIIVKEITPPPHPLPPTPPPPPPTPLVNYRSLLPDLAP